MLHANGFDEGQKATRLANWKQVEKTTGVKPKAYQDRPDFPCELQYTWDGYMDAIAGVERLTLRDIEAYSMVMGRGVSVWEARLFMRLEAARHGNR